jgi:excisionase family DNA binding protein
MMPAARGIVPGNKNDTTLSPMLGISEVSHLLHAHPNTIRRWSDAGLIKVYRVGVRGDRRFRSEDVAALIAKASQHSQKRIHIN